MQINMCTEAEAFSWKKILLPAPIKWTSLNKHFDKERQNSILALLLCALGEASQIGTSITFSAHFIGLFDNELSFRRKDNIALVFSSDLKC